MAAVAAPSERSINPSEEWIDQLNLPAFGAEVRALGRRLRECEGAEDLDHFRKVRRWSDALGLVGVATMWLPLNPLTVAALSTWIYSRWTMIAHHTCHGGYDRHSEEPGQARFHGRHFALGGPLSRARDWLDWMLPEAWNYEHNTLHHYQLGEIGDPDLVERNLEFVRRAALPRPLKLAFVALMAAVWKWVYYAPNTFKQLKLHEWAKEKRPLPAGLDPHEALTISKLLFKSSTHVRGLFSPVHFLMRVFAPVILCRFVMLPSPLLLLPGTFGQACFGRALAHLVLADVLTNLHAFATIVTNHAGKDLYRFDHPCTPNSDEFYLRQVLSSANYRTGGDRNDFLHGWLNYQVEHHCWPTLSMLSYQRAAPELRAICAHHGVPYTQEAVWERTRKTVAIMVGDDSMRRWPGLPRAREGSEPRPTTI